MQILYDITLKFGERDSTSKLPGCLPGKKKTRHKLLSWCLYFACGEMSTNHLEYMEEIRLLSLGWFTTQAGRDRAG